MQAVNIQLASVNGNTDTTYRIFDPARMLNVKKSGSAVEFDYVTATGFSHYVTAALTLESLIASINAASIPGTKTLICRFGYSTGAAVGAHNIVDLLGNAVTLPDNTRIWDGYYEVQTTFTSAADSATISLDIATDDVAGLKAATAISTGTTWDKVGTGTPVAIIPVGTIATQSEKTTAARNLTYTVAVQDLTAGNCLLVLQTVEQGL